MTAPLPPKRRDSRNLADALRHDRTRLGQLDRGLAYGKAPQLRPLKAPFDDGGEDDFDEEQIQFLNSDHATCSADGATIRILLSHIPEPGSEQVYYNGTPLKWSDWSRTDTVLTIPGESWFRAGKVAWVDYAYYDVERDTIAPAYVGVTLVTGTHTSIAVPAGTSAGDLLVLTISARNYASCSDRRFSPGVSTATPTPGGVWIGIADGSMDPVAINLDSTPSDAADGAAGLMTITGYPLTIVGDQWTPSSGSNPLIPVMPTASSSFGIAALFGGSGLVSGSIQDDATLHWTTRGRAQGSGAGKCSIYLGTAAGTPSGSWSNQGSTFFGGGARIVGLQ